MRERARVASVSLPHAGDWLVVAPLIALGLHLRPQEFVLAVKYRLGLAVFDQAGPCPACLKQSDVLGDHVMCCGTGGERIARHNHLRDAIFDTAAAAGLGPVKEGRFLLPGCDRRPADVLLHNWAQGRDAALDVTVVTPMRQDLVEQAATNPGHALSAKYDEKLNGAEELCRRQGMAFFPLAAETFGGWHRVGGRGRSRNLALRLPGTRDRKRARRSTTSGVAWEFCCSGEMLRFWETGSPTSHHHKLMD